jgi:hypothetical protein
MSRQIKSARLTISIAYLDGIAQQAPIFLMVFDR